MKIAPTRAAFSMDDVKVIIARAQEAPLANMKDASAFSALLQRFHAWADGVFNPPTAEQEKDATPAEASVS